MKREEATPNEIPSWELCKYFHLLPWAADEVIPLTFLINHSEVDGVGRSWMSVRINTATHAALSCPPLRHAIKSTSGHVVKNKLIKDG